MAPRREAREQALSLCYEIDLRDMDAATLLDELPVPPDEYTADILLGVSEHHGELDAMIDEAAEHWSLERMAVVDRNVLRIGAYELAHRPDVPTAVAISEAVELAQRYSTEESGRFVNGILAALARRLRGEVGAQPDGPEA
ncbi:MAG TPA: transcription antitermination factor NusB [Acidimicrobiia bacterium]|nr:transcription antitermination factor NusB [Acidimicrobiia bacterium]